MRKKLKIDENQTKINQFFKPARGPRGENEKLIGSKAEDVQLQVKTTQAFSINSHPAETSGSSTVDVPIPIWPILGNEAFDINTWVEDDEVSPTPTRPSSQRNSSPISLSRKRKIGILNETDSGDENSTSSYPTLSQQLSRPTASLSLSSDGSSPSLAQGLQERQLFSKDDIQNEDRHSLLAFLRTKEEDRETLDRLMKKAVCSRKGLYYVPNGPIRGWRIPSTERLNGESLESNVKKSWSHVHSTTRKIYEMKRSKTQKKKEQSGKARQKTRENRPTTLNLYLAAVCHSNHPDFVAHRMAKNWEALLAHPQTNVAYYPGIYTSQDAHLTMRPSHFTRSHKSDVLDEFKKLKNGGHDPLCLEIFAIQCDEEMTMAIGEGILMAFGEIWNYTHPGHRISFITTGPKIQCPNKDRPRPMAMVRKEDMFYKIIPRKEPRVPAFYPNLANLGEISSLPRIHVHKILERDPDKPKQWENVDNYSY